MTRAAGIKNKYTWKFIKIGEMIPVGAEFFHETKKVWLPYKIRVPEKNYCLRCRVKVLKEK